MNRERRVAPKLSRHGHARRGKIAEFDKLLDRFFESVRASAEMRRVFITLMRAGGYSEKAIQEDLAKLRYQRGRAPR